MNLNQNDPTYKYPDVHVFHRDGVNRDCLTPLCNQAGTLVRNPPNGTFIAPRKG